MHKPVFDDAPPVMLHFASLESFTYGWRTLARHGFSWVTTAQQLAPASITRATISVDDAPASVQLSATVAQTIPLLGSGFAVQLEWTLTEDIKNALRAYVSGDWSRASLILCPKPAPPRGSAHRSGEHLPPQRNTRTTPPSRGFSSLRPDAASSQEVGHLQTRVIATRPLTSPVTAPPQKPKPKPEPTPTLPELLQRHKKRRRAIEDSDPTVDVNRVNARLRKLTETHTPPRPQRLPDDFESGDRAAKRPEKVPDQPSEGAPHAPTERSDGS